jgi:lecithin:retinol acyltransferase
MPYSTVVVALISRPKLGFLRHLGVLLPDGRVAHCTPERGEHLSTVEEFAAGQDVRIERVIPIEQCLSTLQRIAQTMAKPSPYHLFTNNCETFANRSIGERAMGAQLAGFGVLIVLALILATRDH